MSAERVFAARLGVVDDHATVNLGVTSLFAPIAEVDLVAASATVDELLAVTTDLDLVVLDLRLADGSFPARNVAMLRETGAEVLAYTSGEDPALVRAVARAGVVGMIRKSEPPQVLVDAVLQALRGEIVASVDWAAALDGDSEPVALSPRESQVLALYAAGEKADRVARTLGISRETVLDHIRHIRAKYAAAERPAHTKVDLYRRAVEDGVLPPVR
ncbi:MAG TPA: LuxR C-terminal-related transcriptional regulator [Cellulomonas sp.]